MKMISIIFLIVTVSLLATSIFYFRDKPIMQRIEQRIKLFAGEEEGAEREEITTAVSGNQYDTRYTGRYKIQSKTGNETLYNVTFNDVPIFTEGKNPTIIRRDTSICVVANFDSKELLSRNTYSVPETLSFSKEDVRQVDLSRTLVKANALSITPNDFEEGDNYTFCYQANPEIDFNLKFGNNSIIVVQESDIFSRSLHKNTTFGGNFSYLNITQDIPYDNLIAYYPFDETPLETDGVIIYDYTKKGLFGNMVTTATENVTGSTCYLGACLQQNGIDDNNWVIATIDLPDANLTSISTWVYPLSRGGGTQGRIFSISFMYDLYWNGDGFRTSRFFSGTDGAWRSSVDAGCDLNAWCHIVYTYNASSTSNAPVMYVNGATYAVPVLTAPTGTVDSLDGQDFTIGTNEGSDNREFDGKIDEFMFFNKILTQAEALAIYQNSSARFRSVGTERTRGIQITNGSNWNDEGFNRVNLTIDDYTISGGNMSARIGQMNHSINVSGLVLYMPFEWGTGNDMSIYGNDGFAEGTDGIPPNFNETDGISNTGALVFKAREDYIRVPHSTSLDLDNGYTISFWTKLEKHLSFNGYTGKTSSANADPFDIWSDSSGMLRFNAGNGTVWNYTDVDAFTAPGNWVHITARWDGTDIKIYLNGTERSSKTVTVPVEDRGNLDLFIGTRTQMVTDLNGTMDEFIIYNRSLSVTEIRGIYSNQSAGKHKSYYTVWKNITSGSNTTNYTIDRQADFIFTEFKFYSGLNTSHPFFTPRRRGNITYELWNVTEPSEEVVDTSPPQITILNPANDSRLNTSFVDFNVSINEQAYSCNLSLDGGANQTMTLNSSATGAGYTNSSMAIGSHNFIIYCDDISHNRNSTETYIFFWDGKLPNINFTDPTPNDGSSQSNTDIFVNVSASDDLNVSSFINFDGSLVGWWRFEGTTGTADSSGNGHTGTFNDDATQIDKGYLGKGSTYDGENDYFEVPYSKDFNSSEITVSAMIYPTSIGANDAVVSFADQDSGFSRAFPSTFGWAIESNLANTLRFCVSDAVAYFCTKDTTITLNTWTHITAVMNSTNITFYKNGVKTQANASAILSGKTSFPLMIGAVEVSGAGEFTWNGEIDDVLVFNRTFTDDEVQALYANTSTNDYSRNFTGLSEKDYSFTAYAQDSLGNINSTTRTVTITSAPTDTCTCPVSGDWAVTCLDNCSITTNCDIGTNDIIISGTTGSFSILANITCGSFAYEPNCIINNIPNDFKELRIQS